MGVALPRPVPNQTGKIKGGMEGVLQMHFAYWVRLESTIGGLWLCAWPDSRLWAVIAADSA